MKCIKLSELAEIIMGQSPKSETYNESGEGIPFYQGNADFGKIYPKKRVYCNKPVRIASEGEVLVSVRAPIGAVNISDTKCCIGRGLAAIKPFAESDLWYIYQYLKHKKISIEKLGTGSTFKAINKQVLENLTVPEYNQEKRYDISQKLNLIDKTLYQLEIELNQYENLTRSRFTEMFGDYTSGWKYPIISLNQIGTFYTGGTPSSKHEDYYGGEFPFISTPSLGSLYIDENDAQNWLTELGIKNSTTKVIEPESLLIGSRVGVGKCSINKIPICINQDILAVSKINKDEFDLVFLKYVIDQYQALFEKEKRGATIKGVTSSFVKELSIPNAPSRLQNLFAKVASATDKSKVTAGSIAEYTTNNLLKSSYHHYVS